MRRKLVCWIFGHKLKRNKNGLGYTCVACGAEKIISSIVR
ncbi:hypothetical protein 16Q_092 [Pseudomonas phage 16Q]|nr:hypothetical protein 16Q_092 [Pseudomonas phage 16Q]